ncbi:PREDICTED: probable transcription factor KAN2 [Lupinus angustifolius]|uniref:probable transcription factor KAN2 n=1 Tax=Lupinus angustifolius TaxID=3871 RepID=UPI00092E95BA|nr:PREDICTED: probable transcription factor KAN2 [Lupinus angustifolius]
MNAEAKNSLKEKPTQTMSSSSSSSPSFSNVFGNSSNPLEVRRRGRPLGSYKKLPELTAPMVRAYNRAKMPRFRWTPELHHCFVHAVQTLGGVERATPKMIFEMMNVAEITLNHIKSHLQHYRTMKLEQQINEGIPSDGQQHIQQLSSESDHSVEELARIQAQCYHHQLECYNENQRRSVLINEEENKTHNYIIFKDILGSQSAQENQNPLEMEPLGAAIGERDDEDMLSLSLGLSGLNNQNPRPDANDVCLELKLN